MRFHCTRLGLLAEKMGRYDAHANVRQRADAMHGDRAAYEATLQQKLEGKMASAREKVAKSGFRSRGTPDSEELR